MAPPDPRAPVPPERLLAHEGFLRALALGLMGDPSAADDVVQGTWVKALERPPAPGVQLQGWLARVARNVARMTWRGEGRRTRRERAAARPEAYVPSVDDVRARERARQAVVEAVLRLEAPYREVVLLRFYEGLPPRRVAERLGLPVETVRTRTRRAVERLRDDLDRRQGRAAWCALLAPFAQGGEAGKVAPLTAGLGGAMAMSIPMRWGLVALLALLLGGGGALVLTRPWEAGGGGGRGGMVEARAPAPEEPAAAGPRLKGLPVPGAPGADATVARGELDTHRASRPHGSLRGLALSGRTHRPVAGAAVHARIERGAVPRGLSLSTWPIEGAHATTDEQGRFAIEDLPIGAYALSVRHDEHGTAYGVAHSAERGPLVLLYLMPEEVPPGTLRVRVVDDAGRPQAGARVEPEGRSGRGWGEFVTDADGRVEIQGADEVSVIDWGWVTARTDVAIGRIDATRSPAHALEIVVRPPATLTGQLLSPTPVAWAGTLVVAASVTGTPGHDGWSATIAEPVRPDGTFRLTFLPEGTLTLLVQGAPGLRARLPVDVEGETPRHDLRPIEVSVAAGETKHVRIEMVPAATLRGRVVDAAGRAVLGAAVEAHLPQGAPDGMERVEVLGVPLWRADAEGDAGRPHPLTLRRTFTDAEGRYAFTDLVPGTYRVRVSLGDERHALDARQGVRVTPAAPVTLEHRLGPGGSLELTARPHDWIGLRPVGSDRFQVVLIAPAGAVGASTLPGLAVGRWEALAVHAMPGVKPVPLAEFSIEEGRLTYLDLTESGDTRVRVRVIDGGRPVPGARILAASGRVAWETDAEGRAAWSHTTFNPMPSLPAILTPPGADAVALEVQVPLGPEEAVVRLPPALVTVRVSGPDGAWAAGARVQLTRDAVDPSAPIQLARALTRATDARGLLSLRHVPAGRYMLDVSLREGAGQTRRSVEVGTDPIDLEVRVAAGAEVRVVVRGVDGAVLPGARIGVQHLSPERRDDDWRTSQDLTQNGWQTDAQGELVLRGLPPGRLRLMAWVIRPGAPQVEANAEQVLDVGPAEMATVQLSLKPLGR